MSIVRKKKQPICFNIGQFCAFWVCFVFPIGNSHARSDMLRMANPCALLGGSGACPPPPDNFFKWYNLVRFGVYFDQILSLKNFKNYHFLYKNFKNCFGMYFEIIFNKKWLLSCRNTY